LDEQEQSDAELLDTIRRTGGAAELDELASRYTGRVRCIVYPLVLNDADADDVTQEAMVRALKGLDGFRADASFSTWIYRVAVNTALNFLRKRNRRAAMWVADEQMEDVADLAFRAPTGEAEHAEIDRAISEAMQQLPVAQRTALSLVAIQGLPEKEAARIAGCAHATLRWRLFRARRRLGEMLACAGHDIGQVGATTRKTGPLRTGP